MKKVSPQLLSALVVFSASACAAEQAPGSQCEAYNEDLALVDAALAIGHSAAGSFEQAQDAAPFELELGIQGGWMVRPSLRLDAASLGVEEGACVWVSVEAQVEGTDEPISILAMPKLRVENNMAYSDPIDVLLSFDVATLEDRMASLSVRVQGPEALATASLEVLLVNQK